MTSEAGPARAVRTVPIVALDEGGQGGCPGLLALPGAGVLPLSRERPVHALDLAVLPWAEGPRVLVPYAAGLEQRVELARPVGRPVVGHHALHGDPEALVERDRPPHEGANRLLPLVGQLLGVGDPAVVVDGHVQARRLGAPPRPAAAPEGPVPASLGYARHLLYVDVEQLPGALALVARA